MVGNDILRVPKGASAIAFFHLLIESNNDLNESAETLAAIVRAERVRVTRIEDPAVLGRTAPSQTMSGAGTR
jgi:hypothetical protein